MNKLRKLSFLLAVAATTASLVLTVNAVDTPSIQAQTCICTKHCTDDSIDGSCPVCRENYLNCTGDDTPEETVQEGLVIRSFDSLSEDIQLQRADVGTDISSLRFPVSLRADIRNDEGERESVMIAVVWDLDPAGSVSEFNGEVEGEYRFIPLIPSRYSVSGGMELPQITVLVGNARQTTSSKTASKPSASSSSSSQSAPTSSEASSSQSSSQTVQPGSAASPLSFRFEKGTYEAMKGVSSLTAAVEISGGSRPSLAGTMVLYLDNQEIERKTVTSEGSYPFSVKVQELLPGKHILRAEYTPAGERTLAAETAAELEIKGGAFSIQTMPSAATLTYGQILEESEITPGIVVNSLGASVKGEFQWKEPGLMPKAGPSKVYSMVFVPEDNETNETMELQIQVGVRPAPLTVVEASAYGRVYDGSRRLFRCTIAFEGKPETALDDRVIITGEAALGSLSGGGRSGNVGRYTSVDLENLSLSGMDAGNYTLDGVSSLEDVPLEKEIEISPAKLTISVKEPVAITMGDPMPELSEEDISILGLVPGEDKSEIDFDELSTSCSPNNSREAVTGTIAPEGLETENYTIIYEPGELIIEEKVFEGLPYDVEGEEGENGWYTDEIILTPNDSAGRFQFISADGGRSWDDSVTITEDGEKELSILLATSTDRDGVSTEAPVFSYKLDTQNPELGRVKTDYKEEWVDEDITFTLSCENSPASPVTYYARINEGEWTPIEGDVYTASSTRKVEFKAISESGLESLPSQEYDVKIDKAGAGKPSLDGIPSGWASEEVVLTVKAPSPMPESGVKEFSYSIDGGKHWSDPIEWESDSENRFTIEEDGDYTDSILVRIVTNVGSEGESDPYTVKLDSLEPEFTVSAVMDGQPYDEGEPSEQPVTFTITPEDEDTIPSDITYFYSIDDGAQWTPLTGRQLMIHPSSATQQVLYTFKAVSGAGTESEEQSIRIYLYSPSFTSVKAVSTANGWSREQIAVTLSGGLPEDQLGSYEYCVTDTTEKPSQDAEWDTVQSEFNVYREMDAYFWFRAVSLCGSRSEISSDPLHIQIDRTAPSIRRETVADITENAAVISLESGETGELYYLLESGDTSEDGPDAEEIAEGISVGKIDETANFPLMDLESGEEYTLSLVIKDKAGNLSNPARLAFVTKPPMPEGVLTEIDYQEETIQFSSQYELNASPDFSEDGDISSGSISAYIPEAGESSRILYLRAKADGDTPASDPIEVSIPPRPENPELAEIDYYAETVTLENGVLYSFDGEDYREADGPISISSRIPEDGEQVTLSYRIAAEENQFASTAGGLHIPARPGPPPAPALKDKGKDSITLEADGDNILYRCNGGDWQKSPVFKNLEPSSSYTFEACISATEQNFSSGESQPSTFSTLFSLPEGDEAAISFEDETITYDGKRYEVSPDESFKTIIEDGDSISEYIPAAGSSDGVLYMRAKGDQDTPASDGEAFSIPARPEPPSIKTAAGLYNIMAVYEDGQEFFLTAAEDEEDIDWDEVRWRDSGSFRNLDAGTEYILYARVAADEGRFCSETSQTRVRTLTSVTAHGDGPGEKDGTVIVLVNGTSLSAAEPGDTLEWRASGSDEYMPVLSVSGISGEVSASFHEGNTWVWRYTVSESDREIEGIVDFQARELISLTPIVDSVSLSADDEANESVNTLQDYLEQNAPVRVAYNNGSWEEISVQYTLSEDSDDWEPQGGEFLFSAQTTLDGDDISCTVRAVVHPTAVTINAGGDILLPIEAEGYSLANLSLPETAKAVYSSGNEEELEIQWERSSLPDNFGTYEGNITFTGEVELPEWASGSNEVSLTVSVVEQKDISPFLTLAAQSWVYGDVPKEPIVKAEPGTSLNSTAFSYTYSGTALDGTVIENAADSPEKAGVYTIKAVYQDAEQVGSVSAPLYIKPAPLTVVSAELPSKPYDGLASGSVSSITLDGLKNDEELVFGRDFDVSSISFENAQTGSSKNAKGSLVLNLSRLTSNYTLDDTFQAVGEITTGEGSSNPSYQSTRALMDNLHIITNRTPTMEDVKLPKGWSFTGDPSEKLQGDGQSAYQTFSFHYTSANPNYSDVTEEIRIPVTTVSANVDGGEVQLLKLETLGEPQRLPRISVSVLGASLPGQTPTADNFYWFSRNSLVRVEDAYATPMGDGIGLLELRYEGSSVPVSCLLIEINSGSPSKNSMSDIMEIAGDIGQLLGDSNQALQDEDREFLQTIVQGVSKIQGSEKGALTLEQAKLLDQFQQNGLNISLETSIESVPGLPAPTSASAWGIGTAASAEINDSVTLTLTPLQPTAGSAMELKPDLIKNKESLEQESIGAFYLQFTLPENISADVVGEIHQAKGEKASDWVPVPFQKDGQNILLKLDSLSKIHVLIGGGSGQPALIDTVPQKADDLALPSGQMDFWDSAAAVVRNSSEGDLVRINAKGYDRMPVSFMDVLEENQQASILIQWNGGEPIFIAAGDSLSSEPDRAFFPLSLLEEKFSGSQDADPEGMLLDLSDLVSGSVWTVSAPDEANITLTDKNMTAKGEGVPSSETDSSIIENPVQSQDSLPAASGDVETQEKKSFVPLVLAGVLAVCLGAVFALKMFLRRK